MNLRVLDQSFGLAGALDGAESFIWTERYDKAGDFEIYTPFDPDLLALLQQNYYIQSADSLKHMIIDTVEIKTDIENGNKLIVKGQSLESILDRRIVFAQIVWDGTLQGGIQEVLNQNIISPIYIDREISNFTFSASVDPAITSLNLKAQYYSENVKELIENLCEQTGLGYQVVLNASNQFVFSLYAGQDRSYNQLTNPFVVFSPTFDNLIKSNYFETTRNYKNYALVSGDPTSGYPLRVQVVPPEFVPWPSGLDRKELFVDASNVSMVLEDNTPIPEPDYIDQLTQKGMDELGVNSIFVLFDGQVTLVNTFKYGVDFYLGDIIQMENEYGLKSTCRVVEMTFSENLNGSSMYPTLISI